MYDCFIKRKSIQYPFKNGIKHYLASNRTQIMISYVTLYP